MESQDLECILIYSPASGSWFFMKLEKSIANVIYSGIRSKIRDVMREHIIKEGNEKVLAEDLKSLWSLTICQTVLTSPGMTSEYKALYGVSDFTGTDDEHLQAGNVIRMRTGRVGLFAFLGKPGKVVSCSLCR